MHGERKELYGGQEVSLGVHLQLFKAGRLTVKQSSIISLCVKQSRDSRGVVAQGCGSINLSLTVSFAEISKGSSRRSGVIKVG